MTGHPGPDGIPPAGQAERDLQAGRRMAAGDADEPSQRRCRGTPEAGRRKSTG